MTGSKKNLDYEINAKRDLIDWDNEMISVSRQCELLGLSRSTLYYEPEEEAEENHKLMHLIDRKYTHTPFYGSRRMAVYLSGELGQPINRKRVQRLMQLMGIEAIYPKPNTSAPMAGHKIYPYLLRQYVPEKPNDVWSTDITYVRLENGFAYLIAVMDWYSRYILSWSLSNTMDVEFCIEALEEALLHGSPLIFNSDQGSQFTSERFTGRLEKSGIRISMDGRGRALDNIFIERLWRSVKYEDIYIKGYRTLSEARAGLDEYFNFYNKERPHQSLDYKPPVCVHHMH